MSTMTFVGRLGRDAELKYTPNGSAVINLAVAYNFGQKDQSGKKPSQWVDAALFGKRAESMAQYLVKGQQLFLSLDDVHVRTWTKQDGSPGFALSGTVMKIDFVAGAPRSAAPAPAPAPQRQNQQRQAAPPAPPQFDDFDTDIPF